jgi:co-chaperonin GroES (HSP10)
MGAAAAKKQPKPTLILPTADEVEKLSDTLLTNSNATEFDYDGLAEAFPDVAPGMKPLGNIALFMIRRPKVFTKGGIRLPSEARATEYYNTQVAKVISLGPLAFSTVRSVDGVETVIPWPEGPWFKPGDYVRVPKYGGDRFAVKATVREIVTDAATGSKKPIDVEDDIIFALFKVRDVIGFIDGDPRTVRAYFD